MTAPTAGDRARLDAYIASLATAGLGLSIDEFREHLIQQARQTERFVRACLYGFGLFFMFVLIAEFAFYPRFGPLRWMVAWCLALGGLGAVASIFLHVLKLMPQESLQRSEEMEVIGRIFLGCLFSLVLTLTLAPEPLRNFHDYLGRASPGLKPQGGLLLLLPFLCGYSIPLVLGLLGKAIEAVELTLGIEMRRRPKPARLRRP